MITSKSDLMLEQLSNHLGVPENKNRDINMVVRTSGSTGRPLSIAMNSIDIEKITDVGAKCFKHAGVRPGMRIIHCLNFQMWAGGALDFMSLLKSGAAAFPYGVGNTKELINTIMYYGIEGISCTPSYMRRIKEVLRSEFNMNPKNLGLKYGFFGGESGLQNPSFKENIENEWGIEALNANYGSADSISMLASENYHTKDGLRFMASDIATASIKVGDQILTPRKGLIGELLITTNYAGGLIQRKNYNIGDIVEILSDGPEFRFTVLGRSDEMLVIRGLNVYPNTIREIVSEAGLVYDHPEIICLLNVSKEDPIERVELVLEVECSDLIFRQIEKYISAEIRNRLSLTIPIRRSSENLTDLYSNNNKVKMVRRVL